MKDQELRDLLEEGTRALAEKLGISLPDTWSAYQTRLILVNAVPRVLPLPGREEPSAYPTPRSLALLAERDPGTVLVVDDMPEDRVRALLKAVLEDVRAGTERESAEDIGEMVVKTLREAGLDTSPEEGPLVPPFVVGTGFPEDAQAFKTLAEAAQEAEHRHAETGEEHRAYDSGEREAYVSKGPPEED